MQHTRRASQLSSLFSVAGLLACVAAFGCGPALVVEQRTQVHPSGRIDRQAQIALSGRLARAMSDDPGEQTSLLDEIILVANPDAWARVAHGALTVDLDGSFERASEIPPLLMYSGDLGGTEEATSTALTIEDLVIAKRYVYRETFSDKLDEDEIREVASALVDPLETMLVHELTLDFGDGIDAAAVRRFLRHDLVELIVELAMGRGATIQETLDRWRDVLVEYGVAVPVEPVMHLAQRFNMAAADVADADALFLHGIALAETTYTWLREQVALAATGDGPRIEAYEFTFWPDSVTLLQDERSRTFYLDVVARSFGTFDEFVAQVGADLEDLDSIASAELALFGPSTRYETTVSMPGHLLRSNGTPIEEAFFWVTSTEDLPGRPQELFAVSFEVDQSALARLEARREFTLAETLRLEHLLVHRDRAGRLKEWLRELLLVGAEENEIEVEEALIEEISEILWPEQQHDE